MNSDVLAVIAIIISLIAIAVSIFTVSHETSVALRESRLEIYTVVANLFKAFNTVRCNSYDENGNVIPRSKIQSSFIVDFKFAKTQCINEWREFVAITPRAEFYFDEPTVKWFDQIATHWHKDDNDYWFATQFNTGDDIPLSKRYEFNKKFRKYFQHSLLKRTTMQIMQYFSLQGRATRSDYWGVQVVSLLLLFVTGILASIGLAVVADTDILVFLLATLTIIPLVFATWWVNLVVSIKRCRDIGINPWWSAAMYIPYIGLVTWLVLGCAKTNDSN